MFFFLTLHERALKVMRFCIVMKHFAFRHAWRWFHLAVLCASSWAAMAQPAAQSVSAEQRASAPRPAMATEPTKTRTPAAWIKVPRIKGRLMPRDIGLVINMADPYSVEVGRYYQQRRGLSPTQVLEVTLPVQDRMKASELLALRARIDGHFGPEIQALALAWVKPWSVDCHSVTGALALGLDDNLCKRSCERTRPSPLFNNATSQPFTDHGVRPSMHLAAGSVEEARQMIDRGVASDGTLGLRGAPSATVALLTSADRRRNVRATTYPASGPIGRAGLEIVIAETDQLPTLPRLVMVQGSTASMEPLGGLHWLPGALADHLTSYGGVLHDRHSQSTVLDWIRSGATASYGNVSEPCNHLQKFPHPQLLLLHYAQGSTAIEAYWKSVAWPQQGLFAGEPLAAPFGRKP
ncbi:MAG: TIGR03790 family protein [Aquabacterium sp.]